MNQLIAGIEKLIENHQGKSSGMTPYIIEGEIKFLAQEIAKSIKLDEEKLQEIIGCKGSVMSKSIAKAICSNREIWRCE